MISRINDPSLFITELEKSPLAAIKETPAWMQNLKTKATARFQQLGFPSTKDEEWKYTNLASIFEKKFHLAKDFRVQELDQLKEYCTESEWTLVFVNGVFSKEHSSLENLPKGVLVQDLAESTAKNNASITSYLSRYDPKDEETFTALNSAFLHHGALIKIDAKTIAKPLIHIVHVASGKDDNIVFFPRSLIILDASSEAEILESHVSFSNHAYFANAVTDIFIAENAKLRYHKIQNESPNAFYIGATRIWQERDSQVESFSFSTGSKISRNNLWIRLNGEGANAILNGLYAATGTQLVDNHTAVDHRPPNCLSNQFYKGILDGSAKAVFNGKIFVQKEAQKTNSYQLNKNLLLGPRCEVNTKPQLEIFADDVRCTHGATIGQLNEDEIFYLRARAIPKEKAVKMLSRGFVDEILNRIQNEAVRSRMDKFLTHALAMLQ